jgi:hypothetical protein
MPSKTTLITLATFVAIMISACGSSPPARYFALNPIDAEYRQDPDDAVILGLGPLRIPDYLNRSQIVTRDLEAEMQVNEFSRWTEPLSIALPRIVATDIDNLLDQVVVVMYPYDALVQSYVSYRLVGDINRFEADQSGLTVLDVQWGIVDADGKMVVPVRRNRYQAQASPGDDLNNVVSAMNDALSQFSRDVVSRIEIVLAE